MVAQAEENGASFRSLQEEWGMEEMAGDRERHIGVGIAEDRRGKAEEAEDSHMHSVEASEDWGVVVGMVIQEQC